MANAIQKALPDAEVVLREDKEHLPYGDKEPAELLGFVVPIFTELVNAGCQVIVVACNTISTTLETELNERFSIPLIMMVPMIKPAAEQTKTGVIAVCATPTTLTSVRYQELKELYAKDIKVLEPDCSDWAYMIEMNQVDGQKIAGRISEVLEGGADVIVLGCSHYHWIEREIRVLAEGRAKVIQPEGAIVKRLIQVLESNPDEAPQIRSS